MYNDAVAWVKHEVKENGSERFVLSPLDRGMGTTIGNALRRVLLSSLGGYSVTGVKIAGVKHEFTSIPNVVEDVLDVICNLKGIVFISDSQEAKKLTLSSKKKGKVFAKDIVLDGDISIVNGDHYIAEIAEGGSLEMDIIVERGQGYRPTDVNKQTDGDVDLINIDASFSPILKVNHTVDKVRVGDELDHDSLTLDIWTDKSVSGEDAVREASEILINQFSLFRSINEEPEKKVVAAPVNADEQARESALNLTIDDLELTARSSNCLKRAGIETVKELVNKDLSELIQIKNFGKKSADEINSKLKQYDLALKGSL